LVGKEMVNQIRDLKLHGYSMRQAARELEIDRRTVKKYWDMDEESYERCMAERGRRGRMMDAYRTQIIGWLDEHPEITASQIDDWLRAAHGLDFAPSYRSVRLYVADLREELGYHTPAKIRQMCEVIELEPGFQAQVDFGEKRMPDLYGKSVKVVFMCMVLSHSRMKFVLFQDKPFTTRDFIRAHDFAFQFFGGRTAEIVYDQDHLALVSENAGDLLLTTEFEDYRRYAGFSVRMCRARDPESKGKIEAVVKFVKGNFLNCRTFKSADDLNAECLEWLAPTAARFSMKTRTRQNPHSRGIGDLDRERGPRLPAKPFLILRLRA